MEAARKVQTNLLLSSISIQHRQASTQLNPAVLGNSVGCARLSQWQTNKFLMAQSWEMIVEL